MTIYIAYAILGTLLFMGGQWYGQRQTKRRAQIAVAVVDKAFTAYRTSLTATMKEMGLDVESIEKAALKRHVDGVMKSIGSHLTKLMEDNPQINTIIVDGMTAEKEKSDDKKEESSKPGDGTGS